MAVKNICNCPDPPGGAARCEPHQAAYCRVLNGVVDAGCADPPDVSELDSEESTAALDNWALELITRKRRHLTAPISKADEAILASGRYRNRQTREEVTFRLPWRMYSAGQGGIGGTGGRGSPAAGAESEVEYELGQVD